MVSIPNVWGITDTLFTQGLQLRASRAFCISAREVNWCKFRLHIMFGLWCVHSMHSTTTARGYHAHTDRQHGTMQQGRKTPLSCQTDTHKRFYNIDLMHLVFHDNPWFSTKTTTFNNFFRDSTNQTFPSGTGKHSTQDGSHMNTHTHTQQTSFLRKWLYSKKKWWGWIGKKLVIIHHTPPTGPAINLARKSKGFVSITWAR